MMASASSGLGALTKAVPTKIVGGVPVAVGLAGATWPDELAEFCERAIVAVVATKTAAAMPMANFIFNQVINFIEPFNRARVEVEAVAPLVMAATVTDFISSAGTV